MGIKNSYFLISVSNKLNLDLCIRYALAGFTNSINGVWTFVDIREGDYVSFLYGAKVHNLYVVKSKEAISNAEDAPPWPPVTFRQSGKTYYFPFRLILEPIRHLQESLVRAEFNYVAENLLLRGGYRRTHFQADRTTLQSVSEMGTLWRKQINEIPLQDSTPFNPAFTLNKASISIPYIFHFKELILQAAIRHHLMEQSNLKILLDGCNGHLPVDTLEVLGEKAFSEGFVDILIKEAAPAGIARKIVVEVKTGIAELKDLAQLKTYMNEIGEECLYGIMIAQNFRRKVITQAAEERTNLVRYNFGTFTQMKEPVNFQELVNNLTLTLVKSSS